MSSISIIIRELANLEGLHLQVQSERQAEAGASWSKLEQAGASGTDSQLPGGLAGPKDSTLPGGDGEWTVKEQTQG